MVYILSMIAVNFCSLAYYFKEYTAEMIEYSVLFAEMGKYNIAMRLE